MSWRKKITEKQTTDFGLVVILFLAILAFWQKEESLLLALIVVALITIISPILLSPFAYLWFKLSQILSVISLTILLSILFFLLVTPTAIVRRMLGKDNLNLRKFNKSKKSVLIDRDHTYGPDDLTKSF